MSPTKGYLVVASNKPNFYKYAINLIESVKDFDPETPFCLVTEERFLDGQEKIADDLILCDNHYRAKLWGMTKTPYDITFYMDADMECEHEDISKVWSELNDHDMVFSKLTDDRSYIYSEYFFDTPEGKTSFDICGGVCLYDNRKPIVKRFLQDWWIYYKHQHSGEWWPKGYSQSLRSWDQFTIWWLLNKSNLYKDISIGFFDDDLRWNYYNAFNSVRTTTKNPVILRHYSSGLNKDG